MRFFMKLSWPHRVAACLSRCFARTGVSLAVLHEACLSSAVKRLAVRAHRLALTGLCRPPGALSACLARSLLSSIPFLKWAQELAPGRLFNHFVGSQ
jgi:hypothetical protein